MCMLIYTCIQTNTFVYKKERKEKMEKIDELFKEAQELKEEYLANDDPVEKLNIFKSYNKIISQLLEMEE